MSYEIDVLAVPARTLAASRFHVTEGDLPDMGATMGSAFGRVMNALRAAGATAVGPAVACYERSDDGFDVAAGFPVASPIVGEGVMSLELPSAEVAHTMHIGSYEELPKAYDALRAEVEARGRHLDDSAPMWEEYLTGPDVPPEQTRTEVYWPLAQGSGEGLEEQVEETKRVKAHTEPGERPFPWALAAVVAGTVSVVPFLMRRRRAAAQGRVAVPPSPCRRDVDGGGDQTQGEPGRT